MRCERHEGVPVVGIDQLFQEVTEQLLRNSRERQAIDSDHVYQPANARNRVLVDRIIERLVLPGSYVAGLEHLQELFRLSQAGKSCLLLCEHYSNFDIPVLFYLIERQLNASALTESVIAMAATKLNEESRFVLAFTEAYTRIVIYPVRMLQALEGTDRYDAERARGRAINRAALREMVRRKRSGHIILLFPSGTRYRPGNPDSKRILPEVDSYMKGFDHVVFVGIAGNTLEVSATMDQDVPRQDALVYQCGPVCTSSEFRLRHRSATEPEAAKQQVAAAVRERFVALHREAAERRAAVLADLAKTGVEPRAIPVTF